MGLPQTGQSAEAKEKSRRRPFDPCLTSSVPAAHCQGTQISSAQMGSAGGPLHCAAGMQHKRSGHVCSGGFPSRGASHSSQQLWASQAQVALSAYHALSGGHAKLWAPAAGRVQCLCRRQSCVTNTACAPKMHLASKLLYLCRWECSMLSS